MRLSFPCRFLSLFAATVLTVTLPRLAQCQTTVKDEVQLLWDVTTPKLSQLQDDGWTVVQTQPKSTRWEIETEEDRKVFGVVRRQGWMPSEGGVRIGVFPGSELVDSKNSAESTRWKIRFQGTFKPVVKLHSFPVPDEIFYDCVQPNVNPRYPFEPVLRWTAQGSDRALSSSQTVLINLKPQGKQISSGKSVAVPKVYFVPDNWVAVLPTAVAFYGENKSLFESPTADNLAALGKLALHENPWIALEAVHAYYQAKVPGRGGAVELLSLIKDLPLPGWAGDKLGKATFYASLTWVFDSAGNKALADFMVQRLNAAFTPEELVPFVLLCAGEDKVLIVREWDLWEKAPPPFNPVVRDVRAALWQRAKTLGHAEVEQALKQVEHIQQRKGSPAYDLEPPKITYVRAGASLGF